ncbi:DUF3857 domain-containing protein [Solimicrobium silvestre]|uniref:Transglutaminase-like domain-containing protein n=1 Tax=Solimicrobium silvestre TaxID=2099400 RepID=A0A2S9H4G6_9BURK|nr:DUF3857 domain-containing protein [Solimicrobium silvestre]PRC94857.1 hypothetical protein S2091_0052 [Solimicrobium silvestre]
MRLKLIVLVIFFPLFSSLVGASQTHSNEPKSSAQANGFDQNPLLPKWSHPLAEIPVTTRTDPVVIRLAETQIQLGESSDVLVNRVIQVNDRSALARIGQYGIDYYPIYQKLHLHRIAIIRGDKVLDRSASVNIRNLQRESNLESGMYGGATTVQLLLDDVRIGDSLWITYSQEGDNPVFGNSWASNFGWDSTDPIELRRITLLHPVKRPLYWKQLGDYLKTEIKPVVDEKNGIERLRFEERGIDAVEMEQSIPSNYSPTRFLEFSEHKNWHQVALWADGLFPKGKAGPELSALIGQFKKEPTATERVSAALQWVQNEIRYFSVSIGENSHRPQPPDTVIKRRYGDCKDKTYLLVTILSQMGIEARPVLLSAQSPEYPLKVQAAPIWFDHVIVQLKIDNHIYYVDPTRTGENSPLDKLPSAMPGAAGLVVDSSTQQLTILPVDTDIGPMYEHVENINITDFSGDAELELHKLYRGAYAEWAREHYKSISASEVRKEMLSIYEKKYPGVSLTDSPVTHDNPLKNRYEIIGRYKLPNPVVHKNARFTIAYDSQILNGALRIPDNIGRNFPLSLGRSKYVARYQLNVDWPERVRAIDTPSFTVVDNDFFRLDEDYTNRGNRLSYLMNFVVKTDVVEAKDVPELHAQAKLLEPYENSGFSINESALTDVDYKTFSFRNYDAKRNTTNLMSRFAELKDSKKAKEYTDSDKCLVVIDALRLVDYLTTEDVRKTLTEMESKISGKIDGKDEVCISQYLFSQGRYKEGIEHFGLAGTIADDSMLVQQLAWARFYEGDAEAALVEMQRFLNARLKKSNNATNYFDLANEIALYQRIGKPLPESTMRFAVDFPEGPWPRPILAMQTGMMSNSDLIKIADALPKDTREIALSEAWFYIGQKHLSTKDNVAAEAAFRWLNTGGIRSLDIYFPAKNEYKRLQISDADCTTGMSAFDVNNYPMAIAAWQRGAEAGRACSQLEIGLANYYGEGVSKDFDKAFKWLGLSAQQNNPRAISMLGQMYKYGEGVAQDSKKSFEYYSLAAGMGNPYAQLNLGDFYDSGNIVERDYSKSFNLYSSAAEQGVAKAQLNLSYYFQNGTGVQRDAHLAFFWGSRAVVQSYIPAILNLGYMYEKGIGIAKNNEIALQYYRVAADNGDRIAQRNLGLMYDNARGVKKNSQEAVVWYRKSAEQGFALAQFNLGYAYDVGRGVSINKSEAQKWYLKAAEQGNTDALFSLGYNYQFGDGVKQDYIEAMKWFRKGVDSNSDKSMNSIGIMYAKGQGVPIDLVEAIKWHEKAAKLGNLEAINTLGVYYRDGVGVQQDENKAMKYFMRAANLSNPDAQSNLAQVYFEGQGVAKDNFQAYKWWVISASIAEVNDYSYRASREGIAKVSKLLTSEQIEAAEKEVIEWSRSSPSNDGSK